MTAEFQAKMNSLIGRGIARGELLAPSGLRAVSGRPGVYRLLFQVPFSARAEKTTSVEEAVLFECRVKGAVVAEGELEDHGDQLRSAFLVRTRDLAK